MKGIKRASILGMLICTLCIGLLTACGGGAKKLSGRYVGQDGADLGYIEFFSDGTYTSNLSNYQGSYSIDGDRLRLEGYLVDSLSMYFKLHGNTLEVSPSSDFEYTEVYIKE